MVQYAESMVKLDNNAVFWAVFGIWLPGKAAGQGCWASLLGKAAGQGCRARLPGKATGQGCRARLPGKAAGQGCQARLPGKAVGQGYMHACNGTVCWAAESMVKLVENAVFWPMYQQEQQQSNS
jgi:hypothetical protein